MISQFLNSYKRLIAHTNLTHQRYLYAQFDLNNRLTGLVGARGTGKTTLLLQYIKQHLPLDKCIYVSLDHIYFSQHNLVDFVQTLYDTEGIRYFFFDEAHKYRNWNQELKNLYDLYPDVHLVFSGSSSLDLVQGSYDLSHRGVIYHLAGMSFREYLLFSDITSLPQVSFADLLDANTRSQIEMEIAPLPKLLGYFKAYLGAGYYPFVFEDRDSYSQKLHRTIEKTVYEDIANFYQLKTENLLFLRKILAYMATTPPNTLNVNNIAKKIGLNNKTVQHYLAILSETKMVTLVSKNKAGSQLLKKTEKMYLNNADLYQTVSEAVGFEAVLGTKREIFFINMLNNAYPNMPLHYSDSGDFDILLGAYNINGGVDSDCTNDDTNSGYVNVDGANKDEGKKAVCFEIGGKNKTTKQIRSKIDNNELAFLAKDELLYGSRYEIPLYLFGFLY